MCSVRINMQMEKRAASAQQGTDGERCAPPQCDNVQEQNAQMQRHKLVVERGRRWPQLPAICLDGREVVHDLVHEVPDALVCAQVQCVKLGDIITQTKERFFLFCFWVDNFNRRQHVPSS